MASMSSQGAHSAAHTAASNAAPSIAAATAAHAAGMQTQAQKAEKSKNVLLSLYHDIAKSKHATTALLLGAGSALIITASMGLVTDTKVLKRKPTGAARSWAIMSCVAHSLALCIGVLCVMSSMHQTSIHAAAAKVPDEDNIKIQLRNAAALLRADSMVMSTSVCTILSATMGVIMYEVCKKSGVITKDDKDLRDIMYTQIAFIVGGSVATAFGVRESITMGRVEKHAHQVEVKEGVKLGK